MGLGKRLVGRAIGLVIATSVLAGGGNATSPLSPQRNGERVDLLGRPSEREQAADRNGRSCAVRRSLQNGMSAQRGWSRRGPPAGTWTRCASPQICASLVSRASVSSPPLPDRVRGSSKSAQGLKARTPVRMRFLGDEQHHLRYGPGRRKDDDVVQYEFEVKARIRDPEGAIDSLRRLGAELSPVRTQQDRIFARSKDDILRPFKGVVVLRIRSEQSIHTINAKIHRDSELDCQEIESRVDDPDAIAALLTLIGYKQVTTVSKRRVQAKAGKWSVCVDQVQDLGAFVEVELLTPYPAGDDEKQELTSFLRQITEGDEVQVGYDRMLLELGVQRRGGGSLAS